MSTRIPRRQFLRQTAAVTAGAWLAGPRLALGKISPNEKLHLGIIGAGNRGAQNLKGVQSQTIVALCDIDANFLDAAKKEYPQARLFSDYRKLLEVKEIEAVVISTADHTHAVAAIAALQSGRHVYCEKPLAHTLSETRAIAAAARRNKRCATQMGIQIHASNNYRRVVEVVQSGVLGPVREVHCWADHVWEARERPAGGPAPAHVNYDLWLGPVTPRPYSSEYHPAQWRRWWHFGSGTLGDFCCHLLDLPFWALKLKAPLTVEAEGPPAHPDCVPPWLIVRYTFGARLLKPPVKLTWYSGGRRPPHELPRWGNGVLFVGNKGMLLADYNRYVLLPESKFTRFTPPKQKILNSFGHHEEWIQACKSGSPTTCSFQYGALLTETGLLGNVAYRVGKKLEWDSKNLRARNCPEADEFILHRYREGW